jgi:hypothetical protein
MKLSEKAKNVIKVVAPTLGAALGGPLGGLAGQVLSGVLGGDVEKALIEQKPEVMLALKKAEQDFIVKLEELGVERERIAMADRSSARELAKTDLRPQMLISVVFLGGYFMVLILRMSGWLEIDRDDQENINTLFGVLTVGVPIILAFWFGSTAGSVQKSRLLQQSRPAEE